jgi:hypothetical protein
VDTIVVWLDDSPPPLVDKLNQMPLNDGHPEHLINFHCDWHITIFSVLRRQWCSSNAYDYFDGWGSANSTVQPEGGFLRRPSMQNYDVVVVGSGAGGATAAYALASKGLSVCMLEAERMLNPAKDFMTHTWPWELPFRGHGKPGEYDGLWKINEYTSQLYINPRKDTYDSSSQIAAVRSKGIGIAVCAHSIQLCTATPALVSLPWPRTRAVVLAHILDQQTQEDALARTFFIGPPKLPSGLADHNAHQRVDVRIRKGIQDYGVDDAVHRRTGADTERERAHREGCKGPILPQISQTEPQIAAELVQ